MSRVSVIIPSWNGRHLLPFCLEALGRQDEPELEVVVVDNGSTDGTAGWLQQCHPDVRIVALPDNAGFAAATNAGIAASERPYILTLNNDAAPGPTYVRRLADFLDLHPAAAACQGRIVLHSDPSIIDSLGIRFDGALRAWQAGRGHREQAGERPRKIPGVGACAALYRRRALDGISDDGAPFDPAFFAYYEDVDVALRLARAGWSAWLVPEVSCEHVGSATGRDGSFRKTFLLGRNYLLYLARHSGGPGLLRLAPRLLGIRLRRLASLPLHPRRDLTLFLGELAALPRLASALLKGRRDRRAGPGPTAPTA